MPALEEQPEAQVWCHISALLIPTFHFSLSHATIRPCQRANLFDTLAGFYRKGYLRWIDATKRRPELRAERIAELMELLKAGYKQRP